MGNALTVPAHVPPELVIDFDPVADAALGRDVFARLAEIRDTAPPVAWSPYNGGHWMVFRHDDIRTVLRSPERFTNRHISAGMVAQGGPPLIPLGMDPPEHTPWRMAMFKHLSAPKMRERGGAIRSVADRLIGDVAGKPQIEFVSSVAEPMPIEIFMNVMGLPTDKVDEFRALAVKVLSQSNALGAEDRPDVQEANLAIAGHLAEVIEARRAEPRDDLVSRLLAETVNGEPIGFPELMSMCFLLFLGGLDTVTNAMTFGIRYLALHPDLQAEVRADRELIPGLVERLLRYTAFVNPQRQVVADTELAGVAMQAGDFVWNIAWAGSNEPGGDTDGPQHLAFGDGPHICAGVHLARIELRTAYQSWFEQVGPFRLAPDPAPSMGGGAIMHIDRLLLELDPV